MADDCCPVCTAPFTDEWIQLAEQTRFDEAYTTHVCPRCTAAVCRVTHELPSTIAGHYRSRVWAGPTSSLLWEDDDGHVKAPTAAQVIERLRDRVVAVRRALGEQPARVLEVGCRDGLMLQTLSHLMGVEAVGLEPWSAWRREARQRGLHVEAEPIETWSSAQRFDLIVDCDVLPHVPDPVEHLRKVAARLTPGGVALIEVPNLIGVFGDLLHDVLRTDSPISFTPRALATACLRAGLHPIEIHAERELRLVCRVGTPSETPLTSGPDALTVAHLAWGNDLRRGVKRALGEHGPTREVVRMASRIHRRCPSAGARADIAIELASHFERCSNYQKAAKWLGRSLADRHDPDVESTLDRIRQVLGTVSCIAGPDHRVAEHEARQDLRLAC